MTAALYVAIGAALAAAWWRRPDDRALFAGLRAALWVGWVYAAADVYGPLRPALLHAAWFAAFAWAVPARWWSVLAWAALGSALEALAAGPSLPRLALALVAAATGAWLYQAMREGRVSVGRMVLHWLSFAGTFACLVPALIHRHVHAAPSQPGALLRGSAAALALASLALAAWASLSFVRAGGTPEPLDAPVRLASDGPFARLRNPIQLAEIGLVLSAALSWPHPWTLGYAALFALVLIGPVRWHEERRLARRFGAAYEHYRRATPAYWPGAKRW